MLKVEKSGEPVLNQGIDEMSDEDLDFFLGRFVAEVRKEDGQEYPGKTTYEMIYVVYNVIFVSNVRDPYFLLIRRVVKFVI